MGGADLCYCDARIYRTSYSIHFNLPGQKQGQIFKKNQFLSKQVFSGFVFLKCQILRSSDKCKIYFNKYLYLIFYFLYLIILYLNFPLNCLPPR